MFAAVQPAPGWAQLLLVAAIVAVLLLPAGALGTRFGLWPYQAGFLVIAAGVVTALVVAVVGVVLLMLAWKNGVPAGRGALVASVLLSLAVLAVVASQVNRARSVPPIHQISTDVDDPPRFVRVPTLRGSDANPLEYDAERLAPLQRRAYPFIEPMLVGLSPEASYRRSLEVLRDMGLEIVQEDFAGGRIEAVATTFWFGFKDDVVVRIRRDGSGSRIDVRSVSRVGRSDLGANAARVGEFLRRFQAGI